jgi:hypothetical protein
LTEHFSADWLALREPFDHAARSLRLAKRLTEMLPQRPRIVDLGGGTGNMFRFLAPIVGRGQDWMLLDGDGFLLDEAFGRTAAWARRQGFAATAIGDALQVSTPRGLWRMHVAQHDLSIQPLPGGVWAVQHDAIVCSALLDLVSSAWLRALRSAVSVPILACLTADGRDVWRPRHRYDALVRTSFRRDMRRDKGLGPALGTDAIRTVASFAASAPSNWHIPGAALQMQRTLVDATADAARAASPAQMRAITEWQEARVRQALQGRLAITIGHRDILILPREDERHVARRNR